MDLAWRLLKEENIDEGQLTNKDLFDALLHDHDHMHYSEMTDRQKAIIDAKANLMPHLFTEGSEMGENMNWLLFSRSIHESIPDHYYEDELEYLNHYKDAMNTLFPNNMHDYDKTMEIMNNGDEDHPEHPHAIALSQMYPGFNKREEEVSNIYTPDDTWRSTIETGEPMDIAMRLLKERVSPEAKRHKLEYDKEYESSPERVKYREDLNRERRKRGMYGDHSHRDISHTEGGKLTVEDEHSNRARHFKDKGTLRLRKIAPLIAGGAVAGTALSGAFSDRENKMGNGKKKVKVKLRHKMGGY